MSKPLKVPLVDQGTTVQQLNRLLQMVKGRSDLATSRNWSKFLKKIFFFLLKETALNIAPMLTLLYQASPSSSYGLEASLSGPSL